MSDNRVRQLIQQLAGTHLADAVNIIPCSVQSVDEDKMTCVVVSIGSDSIGEIPDVQLMAEVDDGVLYIPAVGSTVIVTLTKRGVAFVSMFSELEKILINTGSSSIEMKDGALTMNDGSYGGLIKIEDLVSRMNNMENLLNDLIAKYNTHIHPASSGTTSPTVTQETGTLVLTQKSDLENTVITHGK